VIDGDLIRTLPSAALKAGAFAKVPFLGGHTTDDGSIFVGDPAKVTTDDQVKAAITSRYKSLSNATLDRMLELYPLSDFSSQGHRATVAFADTEFSCTPYVVARKMAEAGQVSYNYECVVPGRDQKREYRADRSDLDFPRPRWAAPDPVQLKARGPSFGALHTSDLYFLFQGTNSGPSSNNALPVFTAFNATEAALSAEAVRAWTTFAIDHKPVTDTPWPPAPDARFVFRESTANVSLADAAQATTASAAAPVSDAHTARCEFWLEVGDERRL
jgi:carboxylesterase type B